MVTEELSKLWVELEEAKAKNPVNLGDIDTISDHRDELLYHEEMMWLQRSRISWLREGERNTRFFHMKAKWRARKNKIRKLKRGNDSWCDESNEVKGMATEFFANLNESCLEGG
jgi:hypothetical protein